MCTSWPRAARSRSRRACSPGRTFPPAVLLKVRHGKRTELVPGQLSQPGGVAVNRKGRVFVTDHVFTGGRLSEVKR